ncbi:hypothetical protein FQA47_016955 [Oryzias melastigma]|uniref:Uncharacterized protein n=1 Tax=Oryzias melastigma TaxID=30732 RepID=A0A834FQT3_ORYME|nr:hypothetical protein FQA47_016955 [Oryzias melastigma]
MVKGVCHIPHCAGEPGVFFRDGKQTEVMPCLQVTGEEVTAPTNHRSAVGPPAANQEEASTGASDSDKDKRSAGSKREAADEQRGLVEADGGSTRASS